MDYWWLLADTSDANFRREIGRRIALRRRELGITQKTLAEGVGLSRDFVAHVETGRLEINAGDMPRVCVALGVPVTYFFADLVKSPSDDPMLEGIRKLSPVRQGELTAQEAELLVHFRTVNDAARDLISDLALDLARVYEVLGERALNEVTDQSSDGK